MSSWAKDREQFRLKAAAEHQRILTPVFDELGRADVHVTQLRQLLISPAYFFVAMPILLKWLPRIDDRHVKEDIVRTLSVKWAKPAAVPVLLDEFRRTGDAPPSGLGWAIGNALEVLADESIAEDLMEFVQDRRYGAARHMVALALGKIKNPRAVDVLIEALDDEDVVIHALLGLGKLKAVRAVPSIERCLTAPNPIVRQQARKALAKIEKARQTKEAPGSTR